MNGVPMYECKVEGGMIHFQTGPIKGHPGYALTKTRTVIKTGPQPLSKRDKRKWRSAIEQHPGGYVFSCQCRKITYHFTSNVKVVVEGYADKQREETLECCLCHTHVLAQPVYDAIEKAAQKEPEK